MTYYDKVKLIKSTFLDPLAKDYKEKVEQKWVFQFIDKFYKF
jgi:hypothetical protein